MSFWRKEVVEFALDQDTLRLIDEQKAWIAAEPANAKPYYHLAMLYRLQYNKRHEALGLLLHAVALDADLTPAHIRDSTASPRALSRQPSRLTAPEKASVTQRFALWDA